MTLSLQQVVSTLGTRAGSSFCVVLPDGTRLAAGTGTPAFTLVFHTERALASTFLRGHMGLLEAYFDQDVDLEGDLRAALAAGMQSGFDVQSAAVNSLENSLLERRTSNRDWTQAKLNARTHYGLGEPFYRLWLDEPLKMYTCAYWRDGVTTLEQAQRDKIDLVCAKLRLAPGERYVDLGCGFGGFLFRAWETTRALGTGVNTTTEQVRWLEGEIRRRGLEARLQVREADFRDVQGQYDKVVSIGVLEHAGRDQLAEVIKAHADFLRAGGMGLLHFIGHVGRTWTEPFIRKHVFPGGWIPGLADTIVEMERQGLEVIDVENLRRHYAPTLDAWAERFTRAWPAIHALDPDRFDERFRRIWMCYLVGCAELFRSPTGQTHLFQVVFSKGNVTSASYPMTRDFVYAR
ncbi:cyclopropane-fatty-acyl-phospholipid synthase family protein [Ramlibacter sp.]|uniref:cyclopropane-fatty-acyl-phospholipid synthase family protein n=1 Tax=Ramlibacter sp. TaxID=1917967 RepID=UPI002D06DE58|nr:cyclopropane-fatty-acyl-phospholipid synthase family protein [Ramlibacter sp.]HWI81391.1 cyclopropane-fatty-acyl-phospholipid synthase family protein [Ramlibacter sp.]